MRYLLFLCIFCFSQFILPLLFFSRFSLSWVVLFVLSSPNSPLNLITVFIIYLKYNIYKNVFVVFEQFRVMWACVYFFRKQFKCNLCESTYEPFDKTFLMNLLNDEQTKTGFNNNKYTSNRFPDTSVVINNINPFQWTTRFMDC